VNSALKLLCTPDEKILLRQREKCIAWQPIQSTNAVLGMKLVQGWVHWVPFWTHYACGPVTCYYYVVEKLQITVLKIKFSMLEWRVCRAWHSVITNVENQYLVFWNCTFTMLECQVNKLWHCAIRESIFSMWNSIFRM